jgi:hypothetical protein
MQIRSCPASRGVLRASLALALVCGLANSANAQWTTNPSANTPIAIAPGGQDLCKVAATPDGGCWIAWFSSVPAPINYEVRIQRLNAAGEAQFAPEGILVSQNNSQSSTAGDWDLRTDSGGNALLIFNDIRGGTDREISAYRIALDGTMLWGENGVQLTNNSVDEFDSRICQTDDGNFTAVWSRSNSGTTPPRGLIMQRLNADGDLLLDAAGVLIAGSGVGGADASDGPGFFQMVPGLEGSVIVSFLRDTRTFSSFRHPTIQRYSTTGAGLWNSGIAIPLFASSVPIAYYMNLASDGAGGAIVTWNDSRAGGSGGFDSWVQRVNSTGLRLFPYGGVGVSTNNTRFHIAPTAPILGAAGEIYVFWSERTTTQGTRGLYAQKITPNGLRAWGDGGVELTPFDTVIEDFMRAMPVEPGQAGAICVFKSTPTGSTQDTVLAIRVDGDGAPAWETGTITVSSVASSKGRFPTAALVGGGIASVWSDNRSDSNNIYAQRINLDGTIGPGVPPGCPANYDFNQDENVDLTDAQLMAQVFVGSITPEAGWLDGDMNGDENADLTDAQQVASFVVLGVCPL